MLVASLTFAKVAVAQTFDATSSSSQSSASTGGMSLIMTSASVREDRGLIIGAGGYDTASSAPVFDSAAEAKLLRPLVLRVGVDYSGDQRRMRPSVGARLQLLRQEAHGVDASLTSLFKTEGFDETEGEIETTFAIGRRFESVYALANAAYGQDPEGNERDAELRLAGYHGQGRLVWGIEARGRSAIGQQHAMSSATEPRLDATVWPLALVSFGSLAFFGEAGPSAVRFEGRPMSWGVASVAGVASVF
jgi:hypothetical protein